MWLTRVGYVKKIIAAGAPLTPHSGLSQTMSIIIMFQEIFLTVLSGCFTIAFDFHDQRKSNKDFGSLKILVID